jgi:hypothetical protein
VKKQPARSIPQEILKELYFVMYALCVKVVDMILDVKLIHITTGKQRSGNMTNEEIIDMLNYLNEKFFGGQSQTLTEAIKSLEQQPSDDCVSRQAVDHLCFEYLKPNTDDNIAFYEHFCDLPPVTPTQSWIPVSERLPECEGLYLVSVKNEHLRQYSKTCWFYGHQNWFARQDVIAWMPLPEPYKAESEDKE